MMRRNLYILAIASLLSGNYVFAQDAVKQWSLEECIQYAIEHNIDLKQKEQEQEFIYSLLPYKGNLIEGGTIEEANRLNLPAQAVKGRFEDTR